MRRRTIVAALAAAVVLAVAAPAAADEPATGSMDLSWNTCFAGPGMVTYRGEQTVRVSPGVDAG